MLNPSPGSDDFDLNSLKGSVFELFDTVRCGLVILKCAGSSPSSDCLPNCSIIFANQTFCNSFNLQQKEIKGKTCKKAFSENMPLIHKMANACQCHFPNSTEVQGTDSDRFFEVQLNRLQNGHCAAIFYDISALKQSEQKLAQTLKDLKEEHARAEAILNTIIDPLCVISPDYDVTYESPGAQKAWGNNLGRKCYEAYQQKNAACENCQSRRAMEDGKVHVVEKTMSINGEEKIYELVASPIKADSETISGVIELARDITSRKMMEKGKERLITELQTALAKVKRLSGLLPICSYCKKIRDDKGYWNKIESYMRSHADVEFSHGICEECAQKNHPELYKK